MKPITIKLYDSVLRHGQVHLLNVRRNKGLVRKVWKSVAWHLKLPGGPRYMYRDCNFYSLHDKEGIKNHISSYRYQQARLKFVRCRFCRQGKNKVLNWQRRVKPLPPHTDLDFESRVITFERRDLRVKDIPRLVAKCLKIFREEEEQHYHNNNNFNVDLGVHLNLLSLESP